MFVITQIHNPDKHPLMPDNYPWMIANDSLGPEWIFIEDVETYKANIDISAYESATAVSPNFIRQRDQREWGGQRIATFIDKMGQRNLELISQGSAVNISSLATDNLGLKTLIETGALSTARDLCTQLKVKYPTHEDIYQYAIDSITEFLIERGYQQ